MPGTMTAPNAAGKQATFKFFTGAVKAYIEKDAAGVDQYFIEGLASSNVRDRQGDTITAQGQAQMLDQAKGLAMFLNHSYTVPEDVAGSCNESRLETTGEVLDLAIKMRIAQSNPRAMKSWQLIHDDDITLGFSIGGRITDASIDEENDDGSSWWPPLIINGIELFEISLVGIPANPRAYTRSFIQDIARSAVRGATRGDAVKSALLKSIGIEQIDDAPTTEVTRSPDSAPDAAATGTVDDHSASPDSTTTPAAAATSPDDAVVSLSVDVPDEMKAQLAQLSSDITAIKADIMQQVSERDALKAELDTLQAQRNTLRSECEQLVKTLAEIKATPTGRQTQTATSGGSSGETAILGDVDLTQLTNEQLLQLKRRIARGEYAVDGRSLAQQS